MNVFKPSSSVERAFGHPNAAGPTSLCDVFLSQCQKYRAKLAYVQLGGDLDVLYQLTFEQLERNVLALASVLQNEVPARSTILIALDGGIDSAETFWAAILAGLVPIPAPAANGSIFHETGFKRLKAIERHSGAGLVVGGALDLQRLEEPLPANWTSLEALKAKVGTNSRAGVHADPGRIAYLQYTSGSTSDPRGVEISHLNAITQCAASKRAIDTSDPDSSSLNWLPWFHDFGLVQGVLLPVYAGRTSYLMPANAFIRRPLRWLEAISRFKIAYSGAPNAAYLACARALVRQKQWTADLSHWAVALCGGEPVRADTARLFMDAFAPYGFRQESFSPGYGLAECVLAVTLKSAGEAPLIIEADADALEQKFLRRAEAGTRTVRTLVGCGHAFECCEVKIVDPSTRRALPTSSVGEIWVRGPSVSRAYFGDAEATQKTFNARTDQDYTETDFLRTGDLGALFEGQLFVTGRLREIIVINGRNLYPQDIELTAERAHPDIREGGVIAFCVDRPNGEVVVIVAESIGAISPTDARQAVEAVVTSVGLEHGADVLDVVLLPRGTLKPTSSGKPRRATAKQRYLSGELESLRVLAWQATENRSTCNATERIVAEAWADVLGVSDCDVDANFFMTGGNSLHATQLASRLSAALAIDVPIRLIFEAPTIAGIAKAIAGLDPHRENPMSRGPEHVATKLAHQLSFSQERIWFIGQETPDSTAYHMPLAIRLRGKLDADALEAAIGDVVQRHEALRTTFSSDAYGVVGHVHEQMPIKLLRKAVRAFSRESESALPELLATLTQQPFNLTTGPLLRTDLIELGPGEAILLIVKHHLVGDQWSFAVFIREVSHFYRAHIGLEVGQLPSLEVQYRDYATWQRAMIEDSVGQADEAYWRNQLAGAEPATLPTDYPHPPLSVPVHGSRIRLELAPDLIRRLTAVGADHAATLSMVLVAALNALLFRYTGNTDVVIGLPVANRHHPSSEALIGSLVNILTLRARLDGDLDFPQLLERVRQTSLDALAHQNMPFEHLVKSLRQNKHLGRQPLFQVLFNMISAPLGNVDFPGLELSREDFDRKAAQFDLAVNVDATYSQSISFEYAVELFDRRTVEQFAERYLRLLHCIARGEDKPVADWPLMDDDEQARIFEWGKGPALELPSTTIASWLSSSLARFRDETAVTFKGLHTTYGEIDRRSRQVALALIRRGISRNARVGICATRSLDMLIAQLGVVRSGAAYVPLDPVNPPARLKLIADGAQLSVVLTSEVAPEVLSGFHDIPQLDVGKLICEEAPPSSNELPTPAPEDPMYVLYTSGSTGSPKGVSVSHRSVSNLIASFLHPPGLERTDRILAITPLGFDISVIETLLPLIAGAQIVLADARDVIDGAALARLMDTHEATVVQATPTTWELLLRSGWTGSPSLKRALVGGEALLPRLAKALLARCPEVWNVYGPTETTVWSTTDRVEDPGEKGISIGRPIHNTQVYVLDSRGRVCPVGIDGELYIGGLGVSQGYVNEPELSRTRFVPDVFTGSGSLYRTGDQVRWRPDGKLQYLSRVDSQVKVRGFRIELTEIEEALAAHAQVAQGAVVVSRSDKAEPQLIAFIVAQVAAPSEAELRTHMRRLLPPHMVPQRFVTTTSLPMLSSGKLDRKSLSALPVAAAISSEAVTGPRTFTEQAMWTIWREVLEVQSLGVDDNFFELGGHSMMALRLVARIAAELDSGCTLPMLFQNPTIASLCGELRNADSTIKASLVALQPNGVEQPLFCVCGIHIYHGLADRLGPNRPVYGIFVPAELEILAASDPSSAAKRVLVEELAADYLAVMRTRQGHGPYYLAGISFGGLLAFEIAQQLTTAGEQVALLAMIDTLLPQTRLEALSHRVLHAVKMVREIGVANYLRRLMSRISAFIVAFKPQPSRAVPAGDNEDRRRIAVRDAIYGHATMNYSVKPYRGKTLFFHALNTDIPDTTGLWHLTIKDLEIIALPSDHLGLLAEPYVSTVADKILEALQAEFDERAGKP